MTYIAELQIKVDTTQLDQATKSLDELSKISPKVESSTGKISKEFKDAEKSADGLTSAQQRLIARAKEQVATFGQGTAGVLQYRAGLLNVSNVVDPLVNQLRSLKTEQQAAIVAQKEQANVNKAIVKSQEQLGTAQYRMIESLREEIALFGKSKEEILLYRAGLMGVKDQVAPLVAELQRLKKAKEEESQAGKADAGTRQSKREKELAALREEAEALQRKINLEREANRAYNESIGPNTGRVRDTAALDSYSQKLQQLQQRESELRNETKQTRAELISQASDFRKLSAQIDPATEAVRRLDEQQDRLNAAFERSRAGKGPYIPKREYERLNGIIESSRKRIDDLGKTTGKTAKEINFAMRGLPAQFTDIFVSLQGGQAPLTVFLQQGGQLKDMFGGVGPAFKAMGSYVLGLVNPFTIAAGAVAGLTLAMYLGGREAQNYNKAIQQTGNESGTSVAEMVLLSQALTDVAGTTGKAAKVLVEIASAGNIVSTSFQEVARAALVWEKATGQATEETIKQFSEIRKDPVKAIEELNDKMNFLTGDVYKQIRAFQDQGDAASAASLAEFEYARALEERAANVTQNLGLIEKGWNLVASAAKKGWDAILDVGREDSESDRLEKAAEASDFSGSIQDRLLNFVPFGRVVQTLKRQGKSAEEAANLYQATLLKIQEEGQDRQIKELEEFNQRQKVKAQKLTSDLINSGKTNAQKLEEEIAAYKAEVRQANADKELISVEEQEKAIAAIRKKYEGKGDLKKPKEEIIRESAAQRMLAALKQQEASLISQRDSSVKIGVEAQKLAKLQQQIADIETKSKTEKLTKEQQSILANKELLLTQQQTNASIEAEIKSREQINRLKGISLSLDQQLANDQQKYADSLIGAEVSDRQAQRLRERNKLEQEYQRQLADAGRRRANGDIDEATFIEETALYKRSLDERLAAQENFYAREDAARSNWINGAKKSFANYIEAGSNVAGLTESFFTSAFTSMEDALTTFVTTGKISFKDLTKSILADLAKMATRIAANQILMSIIGSFGGSTALGPATMSGYSTGSFVTQANGGGWNGGVQFFAKGGAFTNSVVNKPTAFGTGTGVGVMGEAGPEAIMPLTRTSDGQLGVKSMGGGTTVVAPVSVTLNTDGGTGAAGANGDTNSETQGRAIQQAVKRECEMAISNALRPGGSIFRAMQGR